METQMEKWNERAKENGIHKKIVDTRVSFAKSLAVAILIMILLGFLSLYGIRTYYYDFYRDIIENSQVCKPVINTTVLPTDCGDVDVDCECISDAELEKILEDVCPDDIHITIDSN